MAPLSDPATWAQGAAALKTAFDSLRAAIGLVKDVKSLGGGTEQQQKAIDTALDTAVSAAAIAEAQVAKALGYELCKCEFPPTIMKTVGYAHDGSPVSECPKCGFDTAAPYGYTRIAAERTKNPPA